MEDINAFPTSVESKKGMTLRDYFANSAMQGLISNFKGDVSDNYEIISTVSYKIADEMLKQRKNEG